MHGCLDLMRKKKIERKAHGVMSKPYVCLPVTQYTVFSIRLQTKLSIQSAQNKVTDGLQQNKTNV